MLGLVVCTQSTSTRTATLRRYLSVKSGSSQVDWLMTAELLVYRTAKADTCLSRLDIVNCENSHLLSRTNDQIYGAVSC